MDFILFILFLVFVNGVISFAVAAFVRTRGLCVIASTIITELAAALLFVASGRNSAHPEDSILLPASCIALIGTPVLLGSSVGFIFLANRVYRRGTTTTR